MYSVYVLKSEFDGSYYIGSTSSLTNRIREHNFGNTGYTKYKRPWLLVFSETFNTRGEAVTREKYLKRLKSKVALLKIIGEGP